MNRVRRALAILAGTLALSAVTVVAPQIPASAASPGTLAVFEIRSFHNAKCLEILGFNNDNGAQAGMWDCWGGANQKWYWNGSEIRNAMNHKCLEILSFDNSNGARAGMWNCWGGANQQWYRYGSEIRNAMNHKCLEILNFDNSNGAWAGMWNCWGGSNQAWYFV